ncbi:MAG TPA: hypothetical protein DD415_01630 [Clostridiales bacterium]|nr:hypothetical protein [Clostridiales bacterium]
MQYFFTKGDYMPFIQRYSDVKKGGITFSGNTLGLSKATNLNAPGTQGSIGAFTSLNNALQVGTFPAGTTLDYTQNGSAANLTLPAGSTVLYAELVWGGLFRSSANNISALINNSITFTTPQGSFIIAPDPATAQTFDIPADNITVGFYVRTANVTALVQAALSGSYSVRGVPALIEAIDSRTADTNHAGWTLAVAYENPSMPLRNLTIWGGGTVVSPNTGSTTITVTDFLTPETLPVTGKIFVSAQEGDAVLTGDTMLFGRTVPELAPLSGPNNPQSNFFASQINGDNGTLITTGTFGTRNANAAAGMNTSACRQGWDITAVDVSDKLAASQTGAVIRFTSDGDLYVPNALALQIDSKGANIAITKSADKTYADVGEQITYTLVLENTGAVQATNVTVTDMLPPETTLVNGSVTVNGIPYAGALPVVIPSIAAGQSATVAFKAVANSFPAVNPVFNIARVDYEFSPFAGYTATGFSNSNPVAVFIIVRATTIVKSVDKALAVKGNILNYSSVIKNTGSIPVTDVIFKDEIPAGTTFVNGSVYIDGVNYPAYNPQTGFFAANLTPQASVTVTFQVQIN